MAMTRRQAMQSAAAFGAALAWPSALLRGAEAAAPSSTSERRDLYPQGVASGDPTRTASSCGRGGRR
jgi:alkaline phosphatase D